METQSKKPKLNWENIVGYSLLAPAITSAILFFIILINPLISVTVPFNFFSGFNFVTGWTGNIDYAHQTGGGGGYTEALPFYFGLMAIAGAYLVKNNNKGT